MKNFLLGTALGIIVLVMIVVFAHFSGGGVVTGSPISQEYGTATSSSATGTTAATTTLTGASGRSIYVTDISGGSDSTTSIIKIVDGTAIVWQSTIGSSAYHHAFTTPIRSSLGNSISVVVTGSTAISNASMAGTYTP